MDMPRNKHLAQQVSGGLSASKPADELNCVPAVTCPAVAVMANIACGRTEIARLCFERLVRELAQEIPSADDQDWWFQREALTLLQTASEAFLVQLFKGAHSVAEQEGRAMITLQDLQRAHPSAVAAAVSTTPADLAAIDVMQ